MKTWQGWILSQTRGAKNKAMIYGFVLKNAEEIRVRAYDRNQAVEIIAKRLFATHDPRPVAGKTYLRWMKDR